MKSFAIATGLLMARLGAAVVPDGFEPKIEAKMEIQFGQDSDKYLQDPGDEMLKSDCTEQPIIGRFGVMKDVYFWMLVDLDDTITSSGTHVPYLRTAIRDFEWVPFPPSTPQPEPNFARIESSTKPQGPVGWEALDPLTGGAAHRYVSLLWAQPDGLDWSMPQAATDMLTGDGTENGFDVQAFVDAAGLGDAAVGATWFNVTG